MSVRPPPFVASDFEGADYEEAMAAAARRSVRHTIRMRAMRYARQPQLLDALHPGLGMATPAGIVAIAEHLIERESRVPRRWFGFGGEIGLVNARAALLLGRALRRAEGRFETRRRAETRERACVDS